MDSLKQGKEKPKTENKESMETREQFRVVIGADANAALENALKRVTHGFDTGAITKSDLANFMFLNLARFLSDKDVANLRSLHFDEKRVLHTILKSDQDLPEELKKAIRAHFEIDPRSKSRASKNESETA